VEEPRRFIGVDLGASNGRVVVGTLAEGVLTLDEVARFPNAPIAAGGTLCWDFPYLWESILDGLASAARHFPGGFAGISVDAWGIDYALLGEDDRLLGNPVCYRDGRTEGMEEVMRRVMSDGEIYRITGMTPARFATLPQLLAAAKFTPVTLASAKSLLFMPDLVRYFLCGARSTERTIIGTTLLSDVRTGTWSDEVIGAFGIPQAVLPPIVQLGAVAGPLLPAVCRRTGLADVPVIVTAGHDTLAAAAAIPHSGPRELFLSSGTWSVLGMARDASVTSPEALAAGLVNELGVGCVVLARNLPGFWALERLRDEWKRDGSAADWGAIVAGAASAAPFRVLVDPEHPAFFDSGSMVAAVRTFLRASGQEEDPGWAALARAQYEGLAFSFRRAVKAFEAVTGRLVEAVTIVGGGSRNGLFCRMVADATGCVVRAGAAEAAAVGNIGLQAVANGALVDPAAVRALALRSFPPTCYRPEDTVPWDRAYRRFEDASHRARAWRRGGGGGAGE
jgi:rhamnulokinase